LEQLIDSAEFLYYGYRAVIVAMISMRMMQMTVNKVVDVIAMRNRFVTTVRTMYMGAVVGRTGMTGTAFGRVGVIDV
jgi:hypothetical protein